MERNEYDNQGRPQFLRSERELSPEVKERLERLQNPYPLKIGDRIRYNGGKWDNKTGTVIEVTAKYCIVRHDRTGIIKNHSWTGGFVEHMTRIDVKAHEVDPSPKEMPEDLKLARIGKLIFQAIRARHSLKITKTDGVYVVESGEIRPDIGHSTVLELALKAALDVPSVSGEPE